MGTETGLPGIGVVVPSFNQGPYLEQALDSIFRQGYPAVEVVVMDGGSTDGSVDVIRRHEARLKHWQSGPDGGQGAAVNEGAKHLSGELVAWLNSDDYYWEDALWTVGRAYRENPGRGLYLGNGLRDRDGTFVPFCRRHLAIDRRALTEGIDYLLQPSSFFLRSAWEAVGGLRPDLHYCLDWDLLLRILARHEAVLVDDFLSVSREHADTKTSRGRLGRVGEIFRMVAEHTGREATPGGLYYLLEALLQLELPDGLRAQVWSAIATVQEGFRREWGNADGFPERGDPQDAVHVPIAKGASPRRERDAGARGRLPAISVVVPSFNQARFLPRTLDSLLGQGYPRLESLVFDAGSTDGSVEILRAYGDRLTHWVSEPDRGPAHALNKGFAAATGEVLGWLNSDDMLAEGALVRIGEAFAEDPELDLVFANALYVDEDDRPRAADHGTHRTALYYGEAQPSAKVPAYWSYLHAIPQPTVFFRRRLLDACGGVDERYHFIFDFELFFRFMGRARVRKIERTLAFYRIHASSKTAGWERFLVELYRFSRPKWPPVWTRAFWFTWRDFLKHYPRRRFGTSPRDGRSWPLLAVVALSTLTGIGNPEALPPFSSLRKASLPRVFRRRG